MGKYVIKRLLLLIPVIVGLSFLIFFLIDLAPGTEVDVIADYYTEEQIAELEHQLGYDRSVFYRYGVYMANLVKGNLGTSFTFKIKVWDLYKQRIGHTMKLTLASLVVCVVLSLPLGIVASLKRGTLVDNSCTVIALLGLSMPNFWLGVMLIILFSNKLGWLPSFGDNDGLKSIILPAITQGTGLMASLTRTVRTSMVDVLGQDYLRTARAKGVTEKKVVMKHAFRNALIPILSVFSSILGASFGGAVVTETVFAWPGVGQIIVSAVKSRDSTTACGFLILTVLMVCILQLIVDLLFAVVDPRLKAHYAAPRASHKHGMTKREAL